MRKSTEEIEAKLDQQIANEHRRIARATQTLNRLGHKQQSNERRKRTHRLIQLGAIIERWIGDEVSPETLSEAMQFEVFTDSDQRLGELIQEVYTNFSQDDP